MKNCPNCKTVLADHSAFCTNCGIRVGELPATPIAPAAPTTPQPTVQPTTVYQPTPVVPLAQPTVEPHPDTGKLTTFSIISLVGGFLMLETGGLPVVAGLISLILGIINLFKLNRANKQTFEYQRDNRIRTIKTLTILGIAFLSIAILVLIIGIVLYCLGFGDVFSVLGFIEQAKETLY